jgi:hypothetical protein
VFLRGKRNFHDKGVHDFAMKMKTLKHKYASSFETNFNKRKSLSYKKNKNKMLDSNSFSVKGCYQELLDSRTYDGYDKYFITAMYRMWKRDVIQDVHQQCCVFCFR